MREKWCRTAARRLIHDPRPCLLYRQHQASEVGRNDTIPAMTAEMEAFTPDTLARMKAAGAAGLMGEGGRYFAEIFAPFDFAGVRHRAPTRTFTGAAGFEMSYTQSRPAMAAVTYA